MFEEEKKLIAQYYAIIKQKTGEDIDIMYDILNMEDAEPDDEESDDEEDTNTANGKGEDSEEESEEEVDISEDEIDLDDSDDDEDEDEEDDDDEEGSDYEIDLMIGETSEVLLGIRYFNVKKEVIYDLLRNKELEKSDTSGKNKSKLSGKEALKFHFENIDFKIDHDFVVYTKNGDVLGEVTYIECIPKQNHPELEKMLFSVDKDLFKLQVQV